MIGIIWNVAKVGVSVGTGCVTGFRAGEAFVKILPAASGTVGKVANGVARVGIESAVGSIVTGAVYDGIEQVEQSCVTCKNKMIENVKEAKEKFDKQKEEKAKKKEEKKNKE